MKVKDFLNITLIEDSSNLRIINKGDLSTSFYNSNRDDNKVIYSIFIQNNGVVYIYIK